MFIYFVVSVYFQFYWISLERLLFHLWSTDIFNFIGYHFNFYFYPPPNFGHLEICNQDYTFKLCFSDAMYKSHVLAATVYVGRSHIHSPQSLNLLIRQYVRDSVNLEIYFNRPSTSP